MFDPSSLNAPAPAELGCLQPEALRALSALDPNGGSSFVVRVLATFLRSVEVQLRGLQAARDAADLTTAIRMVHSLKSSSAYIGAMSFSQDCAQLEDAMRSRPGEPPEAVLNDPRIVARLDEVARRVPSVCEVVARELAVRQAGA